MTQPEQRRAVAEALRYQVSETGCIGNHDDVNCDMRWGDVSKWCINCLAGVLAEALASVEAELELARSARSSEPLRNALRIAGEWQKRAEEAEATSEGRRKVLFEKADDLRAEGIRADNAEAERDALRAALEELVINANRLTDRCLGGTYEEDARGSVKKAREALAASQGSESAKPVERVPHEAVRKALGAEPICAVCRGYGQVDIGQTLSATCEECGGTGRAA